MPYHILPRGAYQGGQFVTSFFLPALGFFVFFTLGAFLFGSYTIFGHPRRWSAPKVLQMFVNIGVDRLLIESGGQLLCR